MNKRSLGYRPTLLDWLIVLIVGVFCAVDFYQRIAPAAFSNIESEAQVTERMPGKVASKELSENAKEYLLGYFDSYSVRRVDDSVTVDSNSEIPVLDNETNRGYTSVGDNAYRLLAIFTMTSKNSVVAIIEKQNAGADNVKELRLGERIDDLTLQEVRSRAVILSDNQGNNYTLSLFPLRHDKNSESSNKVVNDE